jgi:hypothetical protein
MLGVREDSARVLAILPLILATVGSMLRSGRLAEQVFGHQPSPNEISTVFFATRDFTPRPNYHPKKPLRNFPRNNLEILEILGDALVAVVINYLFYLQPVAQASLLGEALSNKTFEEALTNQHLRPLIFPISSVKAAPLLQADELVVVHYAKRVADTFESLFAVRSAEDGDDPLDSGLARARRLGLAVPHLSWESLRHQGYDVTDSIASMPQRLPQAVLQSFNATFAVSLPDARWVAVPFRIDLPAGLRFKELVRLGSAVLKWQMTELAAASPDSPSPEGITEVVRQWTHVNALAALAVPLLRFAVNNLSIPDEVATQYEETILSVENVQAIHGPASVYWSHLDKLDGKPAAQVLLAFFGLLPFSGDGLSSSSVKSLFEYLHSLALPDAETTLRHLRPSELSGSTRVVCAALGKVCSNLSVRSGYSDPRQRFCAEVTLHGQIVLTQSHPEESVARSQAQSAAHQHFGDPANHRALRAMCNCKAKRHGERSRLVVRPSATSTRSVAPPNSTSTSQPSRSAPTILPKRARESEGSQPDAKRRQT